LRYTGGNVILWRHEQKPQVTGTLAVMKTWSLKWFEELSHCDHSYMGSALRSFEENPYRCSNMAAWPEEQFPMANSTMLWSIWLVIFTSILHFWHEREHFQTKQENHLEKSFAPIQQVPSGLSGTKSQPFNQRNRTVENKWYLQVQICPWGGTKKFRVVEG
jgi:hypothetical protein